MTVTFRVHISYIYYKKEYIIYLLLLLVYLRQLEIKQGYNKTK